MKYEILKLQPGLDGQWELEHELSDFDPDNPPGVLQKVDLDNHEDFLRSIGEAPAGPSLENGVVIGIFDELHDSLPTIVIAEKSELERCPLVTGVHELFSFHEQGQFDRWGLTTKPPIEDWSDKMPDKTVMGGNFTWKVYMHLDVLAED